MACGDYIGYISSQQWQEKRQARLEHDRHTCQGCGITQEQLEELGWAGLQVHHKNAGPPHYRYPHALGEESIDDLLTLCPDCHDGITNSVRRQRYKLDPRKAVPSPDHSVGERPKPARPIFKHSSRKIPNDLSVAETEHQRSERHHHAQWADGRSSQRILKSIESDIEQAEKDRR